MNTTKTVLIQHADRDQPDLEIDYVANVSLADGMLILKVAPGDGTPFTRSINLDKVFSYTTYEE